MISIITNQVKEFISQTLKDIIFKIFLELKNITVKTIITHISQLEKVQEKTTMGEVYKYKKEISN
jgi:hypothetical protein